jgi:hypothetical protein
MKNAKLKIADEATAAREGARPANFAFLIFNF